MGPERSSAQDVKNTGILVQYPVRLLSSNYALYMLCTLHISEAVLALLMLQVYRERTN